MTRTVAENTASAVQLNLWSKTGPRLAGEVQHNMTDADPAYQWPCPECQHSGQVVNVSVAGPTLEFLVRCANCQHVWIMNRASPFKPRMPE